MDRNVFFIDTETRIGAALYEVRKSARCCSVACAAHAWLSKTTYIVGQVLSGRVDQVNYGARPGRQCQEYNSSLLPVRPTNNDPVFLGRHTIMTCDIITAKSMNRCRLNAG